MIGLIVLIFTPVIVPLLAWYFSTWNKTDPYVIAYLEKYGRDDINKEIK